MMIPKFSGTTYYSASEKLPDFAKEMKARAKESGDVFFHASYGRENNEGSGGSAGIEDRDIFVVSHPDFKNNEFMTLGRQHGLLPVQSEERLVARAPMAEIKDFISKSLLESKDWSFFQVIDTFNL